MLSWRSKETLKVAADFKKKISMNKIAFVEKITAPSNNYQAKQEEAVSNDDPKLFSAVFFRGLYPIYNVGGEIENSHHEQNLNDPKIAFQTMISPLKFSFVI